MLTYLDYARRGLNAWWRYLIVGAFAIVLGFAIATALGAGLLLGHVIPPAFIQDLLKPSHPVVFFIGNGVVFAGMVAALALMAWAIQKKTPLDLLGQWRWPRFVAGLALWAACLVVATLADFALRPRGFRWTASGQTAALALSALFGLGIQAFAEEYVFRGYLTQGLLLATKRPWLAAILSGLVFGALHIPNGIPQWANATLFGVITALIAIRTGGIAFGYGLHLINNLFGAVIVVSAGDVFHGAPGLWIQTTPGLMWWDVALGVVLLAVPAWVVLRPRAPTAAEAPASP